MATKNFAANLKIGAVMGSSVGRVFGGLKAKIKDQETTLKGLRAAYKQAEKGTGEYAGKLDQLKGKIEAAERELKKLKAASNFDIGKSLRGVGNTFLGDFKRLGVAAGVATGAVLGTGAAVYQVTRGFVDWADDIGDSAEALGISTQALQTWQFAAATVGVDGAKMTASIAKFSKTIMEGGEKTDEMLGKLGINAGRLRKLKLDEQLSVFSEAFKNYKGLDKTALAMKAFGRSGYQIAGILAKGADGFDEFRKAGEATGAVLTDEAAKAAGDAATALDKFGITMTGLRNTIAIQFVPTLGRLADRFTQLVRDSGPKIREWATQFASLIETRVVPDIGRMIDKLPGLLDQLGTMAEKFWNGLTAVKDFLGGWDKLAGVLLVANFAPTLVAIGQLTAGIWALTGATRASAIATATALAPWVAIGAALASVYWIMTNQEKVGAWFEALVGEDNFIKVGQWLIDLQDEFSAWVAKGIEDGDRFRAGIVNVWTSLKVGAQEAIAELRAGFESFFSWITSKFDAVGAKISAMWDRAKQLGDSIKGFFSFGGGETGAVSPKAQLSPSGDMPPRAMASTQNNDVNIHVNTPAQNGAQFGRELRQEIQRKPLFDMDGALVPG